MKKFEWALKAMDLLRRLDRVLSDTVEAWLSFSSPEEDLGYFSDISPSAERSLCIIQLTFRHLQGSQRRLILLNSYCAEFSRAVSQSLPSSPLRWHVTRKFCTHNQHS
jgi:hypothetical protein